MSILRPLALSLVILTHLVAAEQPAQRCLYMSSPDGAQTEGSSGSGIPVFHVDQGHRFVRRIDIPGFKDGGVRGFTVSARNHCAYFSTTNRRLDVVDLQAGKRLHRVTAGAAPIAPRTHGVALTPDETELWISDQQSKKLFIFDATQMPPRPKGQVDLIGEGHCWVCFSLDGHYAWSHTPDVYEMEP